MPGTPRPNFIIQAGTLWASGDSSVFAGTGGPAAYDPFLGLFSATIGAAGLATTPFNDQLYGVDAGDQVVFVIAAINYGAAGFDLTLRDTVPNGFAIPADGGELTVTDGTGAALATSGNLFDPAGGLTITSPVAAYDPNSGANVALITVTLLATSTLAVPLATVTDAAQIVSYAGSEGGPNIAAGNATPLVATTPVQSGSLVVASSPDQPAATLASGQTASYDVTVTLPEGTTSDLRINQILPASGAAWLGIVSAQIVQFGANLTATAPVTVQPDFSIALGNVVDAPDNVQTAADQIVVRVTVANAGTAAGTGTLDTVVSTANPNNPATRFNTTVVNTLPLARPDAPPTIAAISASQSTVDTTPVLPFALVSLADPDLGQTETLTIHLSNAALGQLGGVAGLSFNTAGDAILTGTIAAVQAACRTLVFTPSAGAIGTEALVLTLSDGIYAAFNVQTTVALTAPANPSDLVHFPLSPQTVLTSTVNGSSTFAQVEAYAGPLDAIQSQFLYEGANPLAIVAQQSNMLISSKAAATAVQLGGGVNVLDMEHGSSFLVSGSGADSIIVHADQAQPTWNTIANFHAGDSVTIYGFHAGLSTDHWIANAGANGWTGATLHMDLDNNGTIDSSITFAAKTTATTAGYTLTTGNVGGQDYLLITA